MHILKLDIEMEVTVVVKWPARGVAVKVASDG
jgi:hypothetical protein